MLGVAEPHRDLALDVERQPLLGAAGEEVHVAADRPQEVLAAAEQLELLGVEHAALGQLLDVADAVDVLGDPEQRVQVAQPALAVLDVGLDQIARLAGAAVALLALGELGGDEFRRGALHDGLVEARHQLVEQLAVAEQEARFQQRGADRHVRLGLADALVDRARGVTDLEAEIPQAIEDRLGDRLAPRGLLVGQQEQQIDVGARRHQAAAVAAGRDDRHALGFGRILRRIEMTADELEQDADDVVLHRGTAARRSAGPGGPAAAGCSASARPAASAFFSGCVTARRSSCSLLPCCFGEPIEFGRERASRRTARRSSWREVWSDGQHAAIRIAERADHVTAPPQKARKQAHSKSRAPGNAMPTFRRKRLYFSR